MTVRNTRGMTMVEVFVVLVIMGILMLASIPRIGQAFRSSRVDRAAGLVALTLERSFTLASRQRRPVTVSCDCVNQAIEIRDLATDMLYQRRAFGPDTEYQIDSLTLSGGQCYRVSDRRGDASADRHDRRRRRQPADHDVECRPGAGGAMNLTKRLPGAARGGFTLVETLATLALLCFIVVVLGPMLVRVSRQSSGVTATPVSHRRARGRGVSRHGRPAR